MLLAQTILQTNAKEHKNFNYRQMELKIRFASQKAMKIFPEFHKICQLACVARFHAGILCSWSIPWIGANLVAFELVKQPENLFRFLKCLKINSRFNSAVSMRCPFENRTKWLREWLGVFKLAIHSWQFLVKLAKFKVLEVPTRSENIWSRLVKWLFLTRPTIE